jgi:hypothetical protein
MSDSSITDAGIPTPAESFVATDGVTIRGSGTAQSPLSISGNPQAMGLDANIFAASSFAPGTPVYPLLYNSGTGLTELAQAVASSVADAGVIGLVMAGGEFNGGLWLATGGLVVLTTAQWDAVVQGESGGLTPGQSYFLNANGAQKPITTAVPTGAGDAYVGIGTAISPTKMSVKINTPLNVTSP